MLLSHKNVENCVLLFKIIMLEYLFYKQQDILSKTFIQQNYTKDFLPLIHQKYFVV